jgi:hypothetical protein
MDFRIFKTPKAYLCYYLATTGPYRVNFAGISYVRCCTTFEKTKKLYDDRALMIILG